MKRFLTLLFFSVAFCAKAQNPLKFNTRLIDCEDKWIVLPMNRDSTYNYGYVYLDNMAGLTLNVEGTFKIDKDFRFTPKKLANTASLKQRIPPTKVLASIIPDAKFKELEIVKTPSWLSYYKKGDNSVDRFFRLGFVSNQWNEGDKALAYLKKAEQIDPNYKGLDFEFAYAYNALEQYSKAIPYLEKALKANPEDCNLYRELLFSQSHLKLSDAEQTYKKSVAICNDKNLKSEMAHNIAYQYYLKKDKENFRIWAKEVKKWATPGDMFYQKTSMMQVELDKK